MAGHKAFKARKLGGNPAERKSGSILISTQGEMAITPVQQKADVAMSGISKKKMGEIFADLDRDLRALEKEYERVRKLKGSPLKTSV